MIPWLAELGRLGVRVGIEQIFGAGSAGTLAKQNTPVTVGTDWELVNLAVEEWARQYGYDLVSGINDTTRQRLQTAIADWIAAGETLPDLVKRIEAIFNNPVRAKLIAVTEATRAFAEGNATAWEASGLVEAREWRTAVDDRVCKICKALHRQRAKIGEPFRVTVNGKEYVIDNPPAHVSCRCGIIPVVEIETVMKLFELLWERFEKASMEYARTS